jgi:hypothetical protein
MVSPLSPVMAYLCMEDLKERALWQVTISLFAGSGVWMTLCFLATQTRGIGEVLGPSKWPSREHLFHHGDGEGWPSFFSHHWHLHKTKWLSAPYSLPETSAYEPPCEPQITSPSFQLPCVIGKMCMMGSIFWRPLSGKMGTARSRYNVL